MYVQIEEISHTGILWKDSLPLTTMVFTLLPLYATFRKGLPMQFFCALTSCFVASVYHFMLYQQVGELWGMTTDTWRSLDVTIACYCLGISMAYLIHSNHILIHLTTRLLVPVAMFIMHLRGAGLLSFAKILIANSVVIVVARSIFVTKEVPVYDWSYLKYALSNVALGLFFFPLPVFNPNMYWLYHSLWHIFIAFGLFVSYALLHTGHYQANKAVKQA